MLGERLIELRYLIALGQIRVEVILAREDAARVDGAAERPCGERRELDRLAVEHGQRAGQAQADRADVRVGLAAVLVLAAAEGFRLRQQLNVDLKANHGLVFGDHVRAQDRQQRAWFEFINAARTRVAEAASHSFSFVEAVNARRVDERGRQQSRPAESIARRAAGLSKTAMARVADGNGGSEAGGSHQKNLERPTAEDIYQQVALNAKTELKRSTLSLAISGYAGGIFMGLSGLGTALVLGLFGTSNMTHFIATMFYPIGFIVVIIGRAQLFTENTLYPVALVLAEKRELLNTMRLWCAVLPANVLGALTFAVLAARTQCADAGYEACADRPRPAGGEPVAIWRSSGAR